MLSELITGLAKSEQRGTRVFEPRDARLHLCILIIKINQMSYVLVGLELASDY